MNKGAWRIILNALGTLFYIGISVVAQLYWDGGGSLEIGGMSLGPLLRVNAYVCMFHIGALMFFVIGIWHLLWKENGQDEDEAFLHDAGLWHCEPPRHTILEYVHHGIVMGGVIVAFAWLFMKAAYLFEMPWG